LLYETVYRPKHSENKSAQKLSIARLLVKESPKCCTVRHCSETFSFWVSVTVRWAKTVLGSVNLSRWNRAALSVLNTHSTQQDSVVLHCCCSAHDENRPATSWVHYTTSCKTQSSAPEDGQNNCPKNVELTGVINKPLFLHLVGSLYYLYQW